VSGRHSAALVIRTRPAFHSDRQKRETVALDDLLEGARGLISAAGTTRPDDPALAAR
jgi:hypothetical protein